MVRRLIKDTITGESLSLPVKGYSVPLEITSVQRLALVGGEDWTLISSREQNLPTPKASVCRDFLGRNFLFTKVENIQWSSWSSEVMFSLGSLGDLTCHLDADAEDPWIETGVKKFSYQHCANKKAKLKKKEQTWQQIPLCEAYSGWFWHDASLQLVCLSSN